MSSSKRGVAEPETIPPITDVDSEGNEGGLEVKLRFLEGILGLALCDPGFDTDVDIRSPNGRSG